jgi:drug/metabolite transporter (DMT)-like permease
MSRNKRPNDGIMSLRKIRIVKLQRGLIEVHSAVGLFGLAGLFGKWLPLSPLLIVLGRVAFASLALGFVIAATRSSLRAILRESGALLFVLGAVLAAHWAAFFHSVQVSSVAVGLLAYACFPVFTVLLEPLFFREKVVGLNLGLAGLCLAGVFLIVPRFDLSDVVYQGVLWGLLSGLTFAVLTVFNRRLAQKHAGLAVAFVEDLTAAALLSPVLIFRTPSLDGKSLALLAALGIICTAGAHTLFIQGMREVKAQTASIISSLEPVYGIGLAFWLLGERPSPRTLLGGAIILAAVTVISLRGKP